MKRTDNRGFSLIELLIAVCIMSIVVIPLLNAFVSSYRVNAKSRLVMRATTLAQNEMEIFEKESIETLCNAEKYAWSAERPEGYQVTGPDENGCYFLKREGISNESGSPSEFDVYITLDPERADASGKYYTANNQRLLQMNTVSAVDSGTYVQQIRTKGGAVDQDTVVYGYFYNHRNISGPGSGWTTEKFAQRIYRTITVSIEQESSGEGDITRVKVTYTYTCPDYNVMEPGFETWQEEKIVFDNAASGVELKSVYLFYAPRYGLYTDDGANREEIVINNEKGLPVDIYLLRQDILQDGSDTDVRTVPISYQPLVKITDRAAGGRSGGIYHTNLNVSEPEAEGRGRQILLQFTNADDVYASYTRDQAVSILGLKALDASEARDRIYTMTVEVYQAGADRTVEEPLAKMAGTKLE